MPAQSTIRRLRRRSISAARPLPSRLINQWASENTGGQIPDIVTQDDLARSTIVLMNAVYFHGNWLTPFDKSATQDGPFNLEGGVVRTFLMMTQESDLPYLETDQFQAVSLPYSDDGRVSMYLIVPKINLANVLRLLNAASWEGCVKKMKVMPLTIILPRFQVDYSAMLNAPGVRSPSRAVQ
jgi:serine protease inhibitor